MSSDSITINGNEYDTEVVETTLSTITNARGLTPTSSGVGGAGISSDGTIRRWLGSQYDGDRDIYEVLGYPDLDDDEALEKYRARYNRQDVAKRIIDAFPHETWKNAPEVVDDPENDTEFERLANQVLQSELNEYFERLDRAQRLGEYGVMVIGYADGQDLSEPVNAGALNSLDDVAFYNIFPQEQVEAWELGKETDTEASDPTHERYNAPVTYTIDFGDVDAESQDDDFKEVHYTRVIHVAEGALETDLKGTPALKPIFNRLIDREKVIGASAEMFYTGADRKIIANVKDDFALQQYGEEGEREDFKAQMERLVNDLQQFAVSTGMEYEVLGGQEVDPSGVIESIDSTIASAVGMPKNKLQGNEQGERATTQDRTNWFDRISSRQTNFAIPQFIREVLDDWINFGILPSPTDNNYRVEFPALDEPTESEQAETHNKRASMLQASGLGMTLSSEQKLDFLKGGPEAVDMESGPQFSVDNYTEAENDAFKGLFENQDVSLTPPEEVQAHAAEVLEWREDDDKNVRGMTDTGWNRAKQLASGEALSVSDVSEIAAWFARHGPEEYELNDGDMDPWEDNGRVAIKGWGGPPMRDWIEGKREELVEAGELEPVENAGFKEGEWVNTPDGKGVISGKETEDGEIADVSFEASSDSPAYVVAFLSGGQGFNVYKASDLTKADAPDEEADPKELANEGDVENIYEEAQNNDVAINTNEFNSYLDAKTKWFGIVNEDPEVGFRTLPDGWDRSSVLQAWASLGGTWRSCRADMAGDIASPARFCSALKDEVFKTEEWRQGG